MAQYASSYEQMLRHPNAASIDALGFAALGFLGTLRVSDARQALQHVQRALRRSYLLHGRTKPTRIPNDTCCAAAGAEDYPTAARLHHSLHVLRRDPSVRRHYPQSLHPLQAGGLLQHAVSEGALVCAQAGL